MNFSFVYIMAGEHVIYFCCADCREVHGRTFRTCPMSTSKKLGRCAKKKRCVSLRCVFSVFSSLYFFPDGLMLRGTPVFLVGFRPSSVSVRCFLRWCAADYSTRSLGSVFPTALRNALQAVQALQAVHDRARSKFG